MELLEFKGQPDLLVQTDKMESKDQPALRVFLVQLVPLVLLVRLVLKD
jgi:hypothetical protein